MRKGKLTDSKKNEGIIQKAYAFFITFNNPRVHGIAGITPEEMESMSNEKICQLVAEGFCNRPSKHAAVVYCVSATGMEHIHAVFSGLNQIYFNTLKKFLGPAAHIEIQRGEKAEAEAYINKTGKYAEKGEKVLAKFQIGEIRSNQGHRSDLDLIREAINEGLTWKEVRRLNNRFFDTRITATIKNMYFDKREQETPFKRDVNVHWYCGDSGSGKTGVIFELVEKYGEGNVFLVSDYKNPFDGYAGEPVIILDEFRGQLPYAMVLGMLEGYKKEVHCRYANVTGLWTEVYITTIRTPEEVYEKMISEDEKHSDPISQLLRRINDISYCYRVNRPDGSKKDGKGNPAEFYRFSVSGETYRHMKTSTILGSKLEQLKRKAEEHYSANYQKPGDTVDAFGIKPEIIIPEKTEVPKLEAIL